MLDIWAASNETVPSNMRNTRRFRSPCACAENHPGLICSLFIHSIVSNDSVSDDEGLDQTAQADLGLRCPHMPEDTFSHAAAHLSNRINEF